MRVQTLSARLGGARGAGIAHPESAPERPTDGQPTALRTRAMQAVRPSGKSPKNLRCGFGNGNRLEKKNRFGEGGGMRATGGSLNTTHI